MRSKLEEGQTIVSWQEREHPGIFDPTEADWAAMPLIRRFLVRGELGTVWQTIDPLQASIMTPAEAESAIETYCHSFAKDPAGKEILASWPED